MTAPNLGHIPCSTPESACGVGCGKCITTATAFAYGTREQRGQWRSLIATMESTLRLHRHRPARLIDLDEYLYQRSSGMIGGLWQLIRGAAILAIEDGCEQITRELLDLVPVDYAVHRATPPRRQPRRAVS